MHGMRNLQFCVIKYEAILHDDDDKDETRATDSTPLQD